MPDTPAKPPLHWTSLIVLGSELVAFTLAGVGVDYLCGTLPAPAYATIGFTLLGLAVVLWQLVKFSARAG